MVRQAELIRQAQDGDKKARDKVVSDNLGLVYAIVRRFEKRGHDREELFQIGCIGLIKAIDHGMVKVSRSLKENGYKISRAKEVLTTELGREPSLLELSAMTELGTEEIVMALDANRGVESIYQPVCGSDGDELLLIDQIGDQSDVYEEPEKEAVLNKMVIRQLMDTLDETEQQIIRLRYFENKTQCEVAGILAVTQVQISRNERKILAKLREKLES